MASMAAPRRLRCRAVPLALLLAALQGSPRSWLLHDGVARAAPASSRPTRRTLLSAPLASGLLGAIGGSPAWANEQQLKNLKVAAGLWEDLQKRWPQLEKKGNKVLSEAVGDTLASNVASSVIINVPAGSNLGVDVLGLSVTRVDDKSLGWAVGDNIVKVNDEEFESKDEATELVNKAKKNNQPIKVEVRRLITSPMVSLERDMRNVYAETSKPLTESDDVMKRVGNLRTFFPLLAQDVVEPAFVKADVDALVSDLQAYATANEYTATKKSGPDDSAELGDLFR